MPSGHSGGFGGNGGKGGNGGGGGGGAGGTSVGVFCSGSNIFQSGLVISGGTPGGGGAGGSGLGGINGLNGAPGSLVTVQTCNNTASVPVAACDPTPCLGSPCPADVNGSGSVDIDDLLAVINLWGSFGGPADVNSSGTVDIDDLLTVINSWGPCP
jgi:hypothetical protein